MEGDVLNVKGLGGPPLFPVRELHLLCAQPRSVQLEAEAEPIELGLVIIVVAAAAVRTARLLAAPI
eukprot:7172372-Prymnesium_polylepis.2